MSIIQIQQFSTIGPFALSLLYINMSDISHVSVCISKTQTLHNWNASVITKLTLIL